MSNKIVGHEVEGLDELIKEFAKLGADAVKQLKEPCNQGAEMVLGRARSKIKDKTGELSRALKTIPVKKNKNPNVIFARVSFGKGGMHGVPLELGHRLWFMGHKTNTDVAEKPFLRPAADESKDDVRGIITDGMNRILDEWGE